MTGTNNTFATAMAELQSNGMVRRHIWSEGAYILRAVPSSVDTTTAINATSWPAAIKASLVTKATNYLQKIYKVYNGELTEWLPNATDIFTSDWETYTPA